METGPNSLFVTLLLLLHSSLSESEKFEVLGQTDLIVAVAGDDIILPCFLKPNISAEDMTVDWLNLDFLDSRVYRYQNSKIIREDQIPSYIGRTLLFKEELWRGNTSLKLTRVQGTDEGHYKCFIKAKSWYDDFTIQVLVKAVGSKPVVSIEGHREGGMGLLCESEGWHPEPELVWLDSKRVHLSAGRPETHRDVKGLYRVKLHVIVQETDTNRFTCRVQQSRINEKLETEVYLPNDFRKKWDEIRKEMDKVEKNLTSLPDDLTKEGEVLKKERDYLRKEKDDLREEKVGLKKEKYVLENLWNQNDDLTRKLQDFCIHKNEVEKNLTEKLDVLIG